MANWCSNTVTILDRDATLWQEFYSWLQEYEDNWERGHIPDGITVKDSYFFSISGVEESMFSFESKWTPPIKDIVAIADKYQFSFDMDFEEPGMCIYGKIKYDCRNKQLLAKYVPQDKYPDDDKETDEGVESFYDELDRLLREEEYEIINLNE